MKPCSRKDCNQTALLIPTEERQTVLTQSDSLGKKVLRPCPVYTHDEFCFFHRKLRDGYFFPKKSNESLRHFMKG